MRFYHSASRKQEQSLHVQFRTVCSNGRTEWRVLASQIPVVMDRASAPKIPEIRSLDESSESHRSHSRTVRVNASSRKTSDIAGRETHDSAGLRASQDGKTRRPSDCGDG